MGVGEVLTSAALAAALTVDCFAAGVGLGAQRIRVPALSAAAAAGMGAVWLAAGSWIGRSAGRLFPARAAGLGAALLLFVMGGFKCFEGTIKLVLRRHGQRGRLGFSAFGLRFLLEVYLDPQRADANRSKTLSGAEAAGLGLVLSADNLTAGISAGMEGIPLPGLLFLVTVMGAVFLFLGCAAAQRISAGRERDLSLVGGAVLILLGLLRL